MASRKRIAAFLLIVTASLAVAQNNPTQFVNPFIGTGGHGHTFPGATMPFGMVQLSPDTRVAGWDACGGYHFSDTTILGFSHTHLSGTGIPDYGDILVTPSAGESPAPLQFDHNSESASPGYYRVKFKNQQITAELTASNRAGVHRYTFPKSSRSTITINLKHGLGPDRVLDSHIEVRKDGEIVGYRFSRGWASDQRVYFAARFSKPFKQTMIFSSDTARPGITEATGIDLRSVLRFETKANEQIVLKVAISSVDIEGARNNLRSEAPEFDFDGVRKRAQTAWTKELGKITVSGGTRQQLRTFYTALYHSMIAPNIFSDCDGRYRGMDGTIRTAKDFTMYTVFSLWDTFRAEHPLLTIIDPERTRDFVRSLIAKAEEGKALPVWELAANETWCMIGYHSVPVIVDAYAKGIRDFNTEGALNQMVRSASLDHFGMKDYRESGYVRADREGESVSKTLEYAYDDWCISEFARLLGNKPVQQEYAKRAGNWQNVFNHETGFMQPKENGKWITPFDPTSVTVHFTEANAWQYSLFVPHDLNTLVDWLGGKEAAAAKLDSLFWTSPQTTGRVQSDITGMVGQYAQGNEPSHHVAYLYDYLGKPQRTQTIVRRILDSLFTDSPDGICGNDDCGQMSAWYVMSALGFYQVNPGQPTYSLGSPLFEKSAIQLSNGKTFTINAEKNSSQNKFVRSTLMMRSGKKNLLSFTHDDILNGETIRLAMGNEPAPEAQWITTGIPSSPAFLKRTAVPSVISGDLKLNSVHPASTISLSSPTPSSHIYFTLNDSIEARDFQLPKSPVEISRACTLRAYAVASGLEPSPVVTIAVSKYIPIGEMKLLTNYSEQYPGNGNDALIDGIQGGTDFRLGGWQGYEESDLEAVLDLGAAKSIESVSLGCLHDQNSWIFLPTSVEFSFSQDGTNFSDPTNVSTDFLQTELNPTRVELKSARAANARYIRIKAHNVGRCPSWHKGSGSKCWLFVDELSVRSK